MVMFYFDLSDFTTLLNNYLQGGLKMKNEIKLKYDYKWGFL